MPEQMWVAIPKCTICGEEIDRSIPVPESKKLEMESSASAHLSKSFHFFCKDKSHNSESDINFNAEINWEPYNA